MDEKSRNFILTIVAIELILNVLLINCLIDTSSQVFLVELSKKNDNELTTEHLKERLS